MMEKLQTAADAKTVYGDPIQVNGKTVVPVASVAYGFGVPNQMALPGQAGSDSAASPAGGVMANPIGVLEVTSHETRFVPINDTKRVLGLLLLGLSVGIVIGSRRR